MASDDPASVFEAWLEKHGGVVLKVARAYTRAEEERQDLVQEILLQVWRSLPGFEGRAVASTWAYRVAMNTAIDWRRREHRRRGRSRPLLEAEHLTDSGPDASRQALDREIVERLYAAIRRLSETDAALVLLYLDDLSYRQIADVLGISESNVGVRLTRARKFLGELLKEESHGS